MMTVEEAESYTLREKWRIFQFHAPQSFWPIVNNGVNAALYCFVWLYFSAAGPGPWSLDAKRGK